jgi:hypothetical protein
LTDVSETKHRKVSRDRKLRVINIVGIVTRIKESIYRQVQEGQEEEEPGKGFGGHEHQSGTQPNLLLGGCDLNFFLHVLAVLLDSGPEATAAARKIAQLLANAIPLSVFICRVVLLNMPFQLQVRNLLVVLVVDVCVHEGTLPNLFFLCLLLQQLISTRRQQG